jgi:hypothetical protein
MASAETAADAGGSDESTPLQPCGAAAAPAAAGLKLAGIKYGAAEAAAPGAAAASAADDASAAKWAEAMRKLEALDVSTTCGPDFLMRLQRVTASLLDEHVC